MAEFDDLMKAMSPVKTGDHVTEVASASRMNAMMEAIRMLIQGENIMEGPNIRKDSSAGKLILSADPVSRGRSGSSTPDTPFLVKKSFDNTDPPYPILILVPGKVADVMPTLGGVPLDAPPGGPTHPWFYSPTGNYSLFLKVEIDNTVPDSNFQSHVQSVKVLSDNDPLVIPDIDGTTGEIIEFKMIWTGTPTEITNRVKGHFYIRIADIEAVTVSGNIVVKTIHQWLYSNYRTLVIAGDEVIVLA